MTPNRWSQRREAVWVWPWRFFFSCILGPAWLSSVVMPSDLLKLRGKTRFGLRLELYGVGFGLLASQVLLMKIPPLDLLVTVLVVWYISRVSQELKSRREPFTRKQKHVLFGLGACIYGSILAGLLITGIIKRAAIVWITLGLVAVVSFVVLVHDYEHLYKDEGSA